MSSSGNICTDFAYEKPIMVGLALDPTTPEHLIEYTSSQKLRLSVTLDTAAGPLRFRNLKFLVFPIHMQEILLSPPILKSIGFDLGKNLIEVLDTYHDIFYRK